LDVFGGTITDADVRRYQQMHQLGNAMQRTKRLLASPAAEEDERLREVWETRLQRQERHLRGLCSA
jgi:hypothetical protein